MLFRSGTVDPSLDPATRARRAAYKKSILDLTRESTSSLVASLGAQDKRKMDEYLTSIREVETRIAKAESDPEVPLGEKPAGIPFAYTEYVKLMFDLQLMAYRADITRVVTLIMLRDLSGRSYANVGAPGSAHLISHHREDATLKGQKSKIDTYHMQLLSQFIEKMKNTPDGDGSLLDHSLILFGSGMGDGNLHRHSDIPALMAGKLSGKFQTGYHFDYKPDTPMSNLLVTILDSVGVPVSNLGDSTGKLLLDYSKA